MDQLQSAGRRKTESGNAAGAASRRYMRTASLVVRLVVAASFAGCAAPVVVKGGGKSTACGPRFCTVVKADVDTVNNTCTVRQKGYQDFYVSRGTIALWVVDDTDNPLVFADGGISIDSPGDDFSDLGVELTKKVYAWKALDGRDGRKPNGFRHAYTINLVWMKPGTTGILCKAVDPIIVNS